MTVQEMSVQKRKLATFIIYYTKTLKFFEYINEFSTTPRKTINFKTKLFFEN